MEDLRFRSGKIGSHDNRRGLCKLAEVTQRSRRKLTVDVLLDGLVGQDRTTVDVDFVADRDIVSKNSHVLQTRPLAYGAVPANDSRLDPGMVLDATVLQEHAALKTHTVANDNVGPNCDIGADAAVLANLRGFVDHDVAAVDVGLRGGGEEFGVLALQRRQVQASTREEVLRLSNVHPEALEVERVQTTVLADGGESLLLDGGGAELDALQDTGVENVNTGVDAVSDEFDGLLDKAVNSRGVAGLVYNDTVLGRLLHLGDDDSALVTVLLVELGELREGILAGHVGVENEEGRLVLAEDGLSELQGSGGAKGLGLDGECDLDVVLLFVLRLRVNCMPWRNGILCVLTVFRASAMISGR